MPKIKKQTFTKAKSTKSTQTGRYSTGIPEFDDVLNGGLVPGATVLLAAPCGVGKTTLAAQVLGAFAQAGHEVIYGGGEMSESDIRSFFERLGVVSEKIHVAFSDDVDEIVYETMQLGAKLVVVDSIQTVCLDDVKGDYGSPNQVGAVTQYLTSFAKEKGVCVVIISHCTRGGEIAGPMSVQHLVDAVVRLDLAREYENGEIIEATKNLRKITVEKYRHGPSNVSAVVELTAEGFRSPSSPLKKKKKLSLK